MTVVLDPESRRLVARLTDGYPDLGGQVSSAEDARRILAGLTPPVSRKAVVGAARDETITGPAGGDLRLRIYTPVAPSRENLPVIVYLHGGGWVFGDLDSHDGLARRMCAGAGCVVVSVDYRRAPEHPFPAALDDARAAVEWAAAHAGEIGGDPARVAIAGDSAGANIAAGLTVALVATEPSRLCYQILLYPVTDHDFTTDSYRDRSAHAYLTPKQLRWYWDQYVPDVADRDNPYAAPLCARSLAGLPPALIVTAECDPLRDEGRRYAARLAESHVPVTHWEAAGTFHGFFRYPDQLPTAARVITRAHKEIRRVLAS